jgi:hypothetical protein
MIWDLIFMDLLKIKSQIKSPYFNMILKISKSSQNDLKSYFIKSSIKLLNTLYCCGACGVPLVLVVCLWCVCSACACGACGFYHRPHYYSHPAVELCCLVLVFCATPDQTLCWAQSSRWSEWFRTRVAEQSWPCGLGHLFGPGVPVKIWMIKSRWQHS